MTEHNRMFSQEEFIIEREAYLDHLHTMGWMFSPEFGYHTQADRDACPDYQHSLATLHKLLAKG